MTDVTIYRFAASQTVWRRTCGSAMGRFNWREPNGAPPAALPDQPLLQAERIKKNCRREYGEMRRGVEEEISGETGAR